MGFIRVFRSAPRWKGEKGALGNFGQNVWHMQWKPFKASHLGYSKRLFNFNIEWKSEKTSDASGKICRSFPSGIAWFFFSLLKHYTACLNRISRSRVHKFLPQIKPETLPLIHITIKCECLNATGRNFRQTRTRGKYTLTRIQRSLSFRAMKTQLPRTRARLSLSEFIFGARTLFTPDPTTMARLHRVHPRGKFGAKLRRASL